MRFPAVMHPEPLFRHKAHGLFHRFGIKTRGGAHLLRTIARKRGRIQRRLKVKNIVVPFAQSKNGPNQRFRPHGKQGRPHIHSGFFSKKGEE